MVPPVSNGWLFPKQQRDNRHDEKDEEADLRDIRGSAGDTAKAENGRDDGNNKEDDGVV